MGRVSLPLLKEVILFLLLSVSAYASDDTRLPTTLECAGKKLPLQASALRTATFLKVRIYLVGYYAEEKINKLDPNKSARPLCFNITYLRDFSDKDVDRAWEYQFKESSDYPYEALKTDVLKLKEVFGEIKGDRQHIFELQADKTILKENGKVVGEILTKEFQKNFLSLWFGKNPPTEEVKEGLSR